MTLFGKRLPLDPACTPWAIGVLVVVFIGFIFSVKLIWIPALIPLIAVLGFFRDPPRRVPRIPGAVVSPADGQVVEIHTNTNPEAGPVGGPCISIFLSVLNAHVIRSPFAGVVQAVRDRPGVYHDARDPRSATENKAVWVFLDTGPCTMTVRMMAGMIARQIVCRVQPGRRLRRGERIGIIRFGSRTELCLPPEARVQVEVGQHVKGGLSILAYLPSKQ
jgi:phosphatidylserine decarboxylase